MWTYLVSVYFMHYKDNEGTLLEEPFCAFLDKITGFIWTYAVTNPGVNALRTPIYAEMVNLVNNKAIIFADFKFEEEKIKNIFSNFTFTNTRPITRAMLAWWIYQNEMQELLSLETILEIEHIYSRSRQEKEQTLQDVRNLEALGNKSLLEKRINIRAADYRFEDKRKYYLGFTNSKNQIKEGTKIKDLADLAKNAADFTEQDIKLRADQMMRKFINYLRENDLLIL